MANRLDSIVQLLDNEIRDSGIQIEEPVMSGLKRSELTYEQKRIFLNYLIEVGTHQLNPKELSKRLSLPEAKIKCYFKNMKRNDRTNNIRTIEDLEKELSLL